MRLTLDEQIELELAAQESNRVMYTSAAPELKALGWIAKPDEYTREQIAMRIVGRANDQRNFSMANVTTDARRRWKR